MLVGHTEGITNVAAKGDGRYIVSNGKDQALRLWDLRKMHSSAEFDKFSDRSYGMPHYDYRYATPIHSSEWMLICGMVDMGIIPNRRPRRIRRIVAS